MCAKIACSPEQHFAKKLVFCFGFVRQGKTYFKGKRRSHCPALCLRVSSTFRPTMSSSPPMARHRRNRQKLQTDKKSKSRHGRQEASRNAPPRRRSGAAKLDQRAQTQRIFPEPRARVENFFEPPKTWNDHVKSAQLRLL